MTLVRAELTKIRTLWATWLALAVAFAANTLLAVLARTDAVQIAGADGSVPIDRIGTLMLAPVYAFIAVVVYATGSEYRNGQIRVSLTAVPDRRSLAAAKLGAITLVSLAAAVPAVLPAMLIRPHGTAVDLLLMAVVYLLVSLIGCGFAVLARSLVTPLAVLFILPVMVSPLLRSALPGVVKFLPHEAALSLLGAPTDPGGDLTGGGGLLVLVSWTVLFLGAAGTALITRDT
jgi:ABC-2 type transport system permease protein